MRVQFCWPFLALMSITAASAGAQSLGGIEIGEAAQSALATLGQQGNVIRLPGKSEAYVAGDYTVTICDGRVWAVTHNVGRSFETFIRLGYVASVRYGDARTTSFGENEGSDFLGRLELTWPLANGLTYFVEEMGYRNSLTVAEGFNRTTLCS